jgi:hypothetical protein
LPAPSQPPNGPGQPPDGDGRKPWTRPDCTQRRLDEPQRRPHQSGNGAPYRAMPDQPKRQPHQPRRPARAPNPKQQPAHEGRVGQGVRAVHLESRLCGWATAVCRGGGIQTMRHGRGHLVVHSACLSAVRMHTWSRLAIGAVLLYGREAVNSGYDVCEERSTLWCVWCIESFRAALLCGAGEWSLDRPVSVTNVGCVYVKPTGTAQPHTDPPAPRGEARYMTATLHRHNRE